MGGARLKELPFFCILVLSGAKQVSPQLINFFPARTSLLSIQVFNMYFSLPLLGPPHLLFFQKLKLDFLRLTNH